MKLAKCEAETLEELRRRKVWSLMDASWTDVRSLNRLVKKGFAEKVSGGAWMPYTK
jgi:hypothetical protein